MRFFYAENLRNSKKSCTFAPENKNRSQNLAIGGADFARIAGANCTPTDGEGGLPFQYVWKPTKPDGLRFSGAKVQKKNDIRKFFGAKIEKKRKKFAKIEKKLQF